MRSGAGVVLDFGCWSPEERYAIRAIAESAGGRFVLEVVRASEEERRRRARQRWLDHPETTFEMTEADHDRFLAAVRLPDDELAGGPLPAPPDGHATWHGWASERWPTLPDLSPSDTAATGPDASL
ncbi:AAA family ATPase [Phycicoccus jejuensis]|uniref:AAA family ATPase n=1 Tax=Phycicoccus jejuensis TaxID=367299 RepID=UPI00384D7FB0